MSSLCPTISFDLILSQFRSRMKILAVIVVNVSRRIVFSPFFEMSFLAYPLRSLF